MNKFLEEENQQIDVNKVIERNPVYKKMLNNLLGVGSRDNATFASSKANNFDLQKILTEAAYEKLFTNKKFKVEITNMSDDIFLSQLLSAKTQEEFLELIDENSMFLSIADRRLLEINFEEQKSEVILKMKKAKNKKVAKWKKFKNKYLDKQDQTNS